MTRCGQTQTRRKRKEAFKALQAVLDDVIAGFVMAVEEARMPDRFRQKATHHRFSDLIVRKAKRKHKKSQNGKRQCEEADIDLKDPGAYDVTLDDTGDEALACVGHRPISKLVKTGAVTYDKYCWVGNIYRGGWGTAEAVSEGDEYHCHKFDFFVESLAVVSDGATEAPTSAPTLAPTHEWYLLEHRGTTKAVQCVPGESKIQCASNDGENCHLYNGTEWDSIGTNNSPIIQYNDTTNPVVKTCPGWIGSDGEDPCYELSCYDDGDDDVVAPSQLSGPVGSQLSSPVDTGIYVTDYNLGAASDGAVYKCNTGHKKCQVNAAGSRDKFTEVAPADMPDDLIMVPAEDFTANAADGSFSTQGNFFIYTRSDGRLRHKIPFAHPGQQ